MLATGEKIRNEHDHDTEREDVVVRAEAQTAGALRASDSGGSPWVEKTRHFVSMIQASYLPTDRKHAD